MLNYCGNIIKKGGIFFFSAFIFSMVTGCHQRGETINNLMGEGKPAFQCIAVVPFQQVTMEKDKIEAVSCPLCGATFLSDGYLTDAEKRVESIFLQWIKENRRFTIISPEMAGNVYRRISADLPKVSLPEILKKVGAELGADGVAVGYVYRYRERKGRSYSVEKPASVAFDIHLLRVNDGTLAWKGTFDRTQSSLMENLFLISSFFKQGGKWVTAEELTEGGMAEILKTFPQGR